MKRLALLSALVVAACVPTREPSTPAPDPTFTLNICLVDDAGPVDGQFRTDGIQPRAWTPVNPLTGCLDVRGLMSAGFNVIASAKDHAEVVKGIDQPVNQTVTIMLPRTARSNAGESGPLHVQGTTFRREDGSIFPWVGASDFALFARFARGEDITPILDERIALGFNILRVFGMFDQFGIGAASGLGGFFPNALLHDDYYDLLRQFVELTQSRGLRVEIVALADADARSDGTGGLMPTLEQQQDHVARTVQALAGTWGAVLEYSNEAFKNADRVEQIHADCHAAGLLCAYGTKLPDGDIPTVWPILDFLTPHDHERKDEWPRTSRGYGEIVDALKVPVVADEPIGFAEVARPGSRATSADDAAYFAATMAMFASGSTFHSDDGVASRLFSPVQKEAAKAWTWAARWVPPEAQLAAYQRGGDCGTGGIGEMPIEHCDLETGAPSRDLRAFCKWAFDAEWCVRIRPVGPTIARAGWHIIDEPRPGFVRLTR